MSPPISLVSSAAITSQLTDTGVALVAGAGDISAPALLRHKTSLITGTVIAKNYVLRITAVIIVSGEPIEVPSCGAEKICAQVLCPVATQHPAIMGTHWDGKYLDSLIL